MNIRVISLFLAVLGLASNLQAVEVDISGYATFAGAFTNAKTTTGSNAVYVNGLATEDLKFDQQTHLGLQIAATVSDKIDMTVVLQADGSKNNYNVNAQWAYATYRFDEDLSVRMGKYKATFYMVSDYKEVGYAYPWVRPPLEVYSTNPIEAFTGLDLVYQTDIRNMSLLLEIFAGSGDHTSKYIPSTTDAPTGTPYNGLGDSTKKGQSIDFDTPNAKGFNLSLSGEIGTFRVGYFETGVNSAAFNIHDAFGSFGGIGFNIDWRNLVVYSEYIIRDTAANLAGAFPDQKAYYITTGYRMGKYLPYVTYANMSKGKDDSPYSQLQSSIAVGLRTEVSDSAALKFEIMTVTPKKNASAGFNTTTAGYGLFDNPVKSGTVASVTFDVIF